MDRSQLAQFDLDPHKNEFLFLEHGRPRIRLVLLAGAVIFLLWIASALVAPNQTWNSLHGRGAGIAALFLLVPLAVRVSILALTLGWMFEALYRGTVRSFDNKPDFMIGASGIADLNPWSPQIIFWDDLAEVRRVMTRPTLLRNSQSIALLFVAARPQPRWLMAAIWEALPSFITERRIQITPDTVGMNDDVFGKLIERYAGRVAIRDTTIM